MEYIVKVCGEVVDNQHKAYAIKAKTENEARKIAEQNFSEEFFTNGNVMVVEKPFNRKKRSIFALVAMIIPILLSFISWKHNHTTISISPDFISCLFAIMIYGAFVMRFKGIERTVQSGFDVLFAVFSVVLISTFIKILLLETNFRLLGGLVTIPINTYVILIFAVILSWLGLKVVSLACIGLIIICALGNIIGLNAAMGTLWGTMYVVSSFLGIMMYVSVEPAFMESKNSFYRFSKNSINYLNEDLSRAKTQALNTKKVIDEKLNNNK